MSGIYISGMEMPTSCYDCSFSVEAYEGSGVYSCVVTDNCVCKGAGRHDDCPLITVPDHGRLIDADALSEEHRKRAYATNGGSYQFHITAKAWVDEAPTIIPEDKEGE